MNEVAIKRHNFDLAQKRLKEFSEKGEAKLAIDRVRTDGGFFGLGNHKVTGSELNSRLETIQEHFITVNTTNNKIIKEFREVYNALDALDKEYIAGILANVKAIEKTSNDVRVQQGTLKQHHEKLAKQQSKLDAHQTEIEKNVENISKIVAVLKNFQEKLEGYKHLTDIDKIWNDCKTIQNKIQTVSDSITKLSKKTTEDIASANNKNKALSDQVNRDILTLRNEAKSFKEFFSELSEKIEYTANLLDNQIPVIQETSVFAEQLKDISHLDDVDSMWNNINEAKDNFNTIEKALQNMDADILKMQEHIDEIESFIAVLNSYAHLQDIDTMWGDLDVAKANIKKISKDINDNNENLQIHQNELDTLVATNTEHKAFIDTLFKKLVDAEEYALNSRKSITELESFRANVSTLNHLMELDAVWQQTEEHKVCLKNLEQTDKLHSDKLDELIQADNRLLQRIDLNEGDINTLKEYKEKLSDIVHLEDIDNIWKSVDEHNSKLTENAKKDEELAVAIQKNKDEVDKKIANAVQTSNAAIESLTKKIKYAYWFTGGFAGLAIIELILLITKVI